MTAFIQAPKETAEFAVLHWKFEKITAPLVYLEQGSWLYKDIAAAELACQRLCQLYGRHSHQLTYHRRAKS